MIIISMCVIIVKLLPMVNNDSINDIGTNTNDDNSSDVNINNDDLQESQGVPWHRRE